QYAAIQETAEGRAVRSPLFRFSPVHLSISLSRDLPSPGGDVWASGGTLWRILAGLFAGGEHSRGSSSPEREANLPKV
ncbi:hypothetical protein EJB05_43651, partial [Eragrostis curvula]